MSDGHAANFTAAFFVSSADRELNMTLQKFWERESSGWKSKGLVTHLKMKMWFSKSKNH